MVTFICSLDNLAEVIQSGYTPCKIMQIGEDEVMVCLPEATPNRELIDQMGTMGIECCTSSEDISWDFITNAQALDLLKTGMAAVEDFMV